MPSMLKQFLKAFNPQFAIKIESIEGKQIPTDLITFLEKVISQKYPSFCDANHATIYIGTVKENR